MLYRVKLFWEISQSSLQNTCNGHSIFTKLQVIGRNFIKQDSNNEMFSEIFIFLFMKCFSFPLFDEAPVEAATGSVNLKNFATFTGKQLCWNLFLIKLQSWRTATLVKKKTPTRVFSCEYYEIFKNTNFEKHLRMAATTPVNDCSWMFLTLK